MSLPVQIAAVTFSHRSAKRRDAARRDRASASRKRSHTELLGSARIALQEAASLNRRASRGIDESAVFPTGAAVDARLASFSALAPERREFGHFGHYPPAQAFDPRPHLGAQRSISSEWELPTWAPWAEKEPNARVLDHPERQSKVQQAAEAFTESLGMRMRQERELKGISLEEMAQVTRIPLRTLQKMEEDRFAELPGEVFVRGFLRTYAKTVGLHAEALVRLYMRRHEPVVQDTVVPTTLSSERHGRFSLAIAMVVLFVLFTLAVSIVLRPRYREAPLELSQRSPSSLEHREVAEGVLSRQSGRLDSSHRPT